MSARRSVSRTDEHAAARLGTQVREIHAGMPRASRFTRVFPRISQLMDISRGGRGRRREARGERVVPPAESDWYIAAGLRSSPLSKFRASATSSRGYRGPCGDSS